MRKFYLLILAAVLASGAYAQTIVVDNFEGYSDDAAVQAAWTYSKAGGPDGLTWGLDTNAPPQGKKSLKNECQYAGKMVA